MNKIIKIIKPSQKIKERIVFKNVPKRFPIKNPKKSVNKAKEKTSLKKVFFLSKFKNSIFRKNTVLVIKGLKQYIFLLIFSHY